MKFNRAFGGVIALGLWSGAAAPAPAQVAWSGGGGDALWSTPDNWLGGTPPGTFDAVVFDGGLNLVPDLDSDLFLESVRFEAGASAFNLISSNSSVLGFSGIRNLSAFEQNLSLQVELSGGQVFVSDVGNGLVFNGPVTVNAAAIVVANDFGFGEPVSVSFNGPISGSANLVIGRDYASEQNSQTTIRDAATFIGTTQIYQTLQLGGTLTGGGSLASEEILISAPNNFNSSDRGALILGEAGAELVNNDRLSDTAVLSMENGALVLNGSSEGSAASETIGTLSLDRGHSLVRVDEGGAGGETLLVISDGLNRAPGATLELQILGGAASIEFGNVNGWVGANFIGAAGTPSATDRSVVPWMSSNGPSGLAHVSLIENAGVYSASPLLDSEYATDLNTAAAFDNVSTTSGDVLNASTSVNALRANGVLDLNSNTLSVGSGSVILRDAAYVSGGAIDFGTREGVIISDASGNALSAEIRGSGGLALSGASLSLNAASSYSGTTTNNTNLEVSTNNAFGDGTGTLVLAQDTRTNFLGGASQVLNPIRVEGSFAQMNTSDTHVEFQGDLEIAQPRGTFSAFYLGSSYSGADTGSGFTYNGNIHGTSSTAFSLAPGINTTGVVNGVISDAPGSSLFIFKIGAGTAVLTNDNTFNGGVLHIEGRLLVNNTVGSGTGTGFVTVQGAESILGGTGAILGTVEIQGGVLAPGQSPGVLSFGSDLRFTNSATFHVELGGTLTGEFDQALMLSSLSLVEIAPDTELIVDLLYAPGIGDSFRIIDSAGTITGSFVGLPSSGSTFIVPFGPDSFEFAIEYGNEHVTLTVIPEPATSALLIAAGLVLIAWMRRSRTGE